LAVDAADEPRRRWTNGTSIGSTPMRNGPARPAASRSHFMAPATKRGDTAREIGLSAQGMTNIATAP